MMATTVVCWCLLLLEISFARLSLSRTSPRQRRSLLTNASFRCAPSPLVHRTIQLYSNQLLERSNLGVRVYGYLLDHKSTQPVLGREAWDAVERLHGHIVANCAGDHEDVSLYFQDREICRIAPPGNAPHVPVAAVCIVGTTCTSVTVRPTPPIQTATTGTCGALPSDVFSRVRHTPANTTMGTCGTLSGAMLLQSLILEPNYTGTCRRAAATGVSMLPWASGPTSPSSRSGMPYVFERHSRLTGMLIETAFRNTSALPAIDTPGWWHTSKYDNTVILCIYSWLPCCKIEHTHEPHQT